MSIALRAELDVTHSQAVSCTAEEVQHTSTELHSLPEQLQNGRPLFQGIQPLASYLWELNEPKCMQRCWSEL